MLNKGDKIRADFLVQVADEKKVSSLDGTSDFISDKTFNDIQRSLDKSWKKHTGGYVKPNADSKSKQTNDRECQCLVS